MGAEKIVDSRRIGDRDGGLIIVSYIGFSDLRRPKPIHLEWAMRTVTEARVLGASPREGEAIFFW